MNLLLILLAFQKIVLTQPNNIQPPGFSFACYPSPTSPVKDCGLDPAGSIKLVNDPTKAGYPFLQAVGGSSVDLAPGFGFFITSTSGALQVGIDQTVVMQRVNPPSGSGPIPASMSSNVWAADSEFLYVVVQQGGKYMWARTPLQTKW